MNFDLDLKFYCNFCNAKLETEEDYCFGESNVVYVFPCKKCTEKNIKRLLDKRNIKNWEKRCKNAEKRCTNMIKELAKLSIEYNKLAKPKRPRCGVGERPDDSTAEKET